MSQKKSRRPDLTRFARVTMFLTVLLVLGRHAPLLATDSRALTITRQQQATFTNNPTNDLPASHGCRGVQDSDVCFGSAPRGGVTININGGTLHFDLCSQGIDRFALDAPCRVTPPMIPPGADTQLGTGLNPIAIVDNGGASVRFGGLTNDPVPSGSSNILIPGFLVHGPAGEQTLRCLSRETCGFNTDQNIITHYQNFRSVPTGIPSLPGGSPCAESRCNHIVFSIDQQMFGDDAANSPFRIEFNIDSTTDANGNLVSATGNWAQTCSTGGCGDESGTFHLNPTVFSPSSAGFVTIDSVTGGGCLAGVQVDPFHANGQSCR